MVAGSVLLVLAAGLSSCGDDDDSGSKSKSVSAAAAGSQGDGSDAKYVELVCAATRKFNDEVQGIVKNVTSGGQSQPNQAQTEKLVAKPTAEFAAALKAINTPTDIRGWHEANANQLAAVAVAYETGQSPPTQAAAVQLSSAASARLNKIAAGNADCKISGSPFGPQ